MNEMKTGYDWCFGLNYRILDLSDWDTNETFYEESYYTELITSDEFLRRIKLCRIKVNSMPRKTPMYLEYRMYGLVPYNISPIQQAIQFGHAIVEYGLDHNDEIYQKWARKDKTFMIYNGGTTNSNELSFGLLNQHAVFLKENGVVTSEFYEPDLGDQLTAVVFLVDERVFNTTLYPNFIFEKLPESNRKPSKKALTQLDERNEANYQKWVEKIGGVKNAFLREFLGPLRFA